MAQDKVNESLIPSLESSSLLEGSNDADNEIDTSLVTANANGSIVERAEYIQSIIGVLTGAAADTASTATVIQLLRQIAEAVNNGTGGAIAANKSLVDYIGAASTSSLVARLGGLTDAAADTASTATIIALLRQIAEVANNGTGSAIGENLSLVDLLGAFDGGADPQGDIYQALGVAADKSVKDLIDDLDTVVDGVETKVDTVDTVVDGIATDLATTDGKIDTIDSNVDDIETLLGLIADTADETAGTASIMNLVRALTARGISRIARKTVTFDGGVGSGAVGTVALFTVTGLVKMRVIARCTTLLTSDAAPGGATIEVGISGTTNKFIAQTTAEDIDADEIWHDATPDASIEADTVAVMWLNNGADVIATIATDDVVSGVLEFDVEYVPISADGAVVAA